MRLVRSMQWNLYMCTCIAWITSKAATRRTRFGRLYLQLFSDVNRINPCQLPISLRMVDSLSITSTSHRVESLISPGGVE